MNMLNRDLGTGDLCDNIGLVGVSAKWSYVTASPSHHDQAVPILSPLLFMHVSHPYIPLFKIQRIFDLLVMLGTDVSPAAIGLICHFLQCNSSGIGCDAAFTNEYCNEVSADSKDRFQQHCQVICRETGAA